MYNNIRTKSYITYHIEVELKVIVFYVDIIHIIKTALLAARWLIFLLGISNIANSY